MYTRGLDLGRLSDDEYIHATHVDDMVVAPLWRASSDVADVLLFVSELTLDNPIQKEYVKGEVESLISGLKDILDYLEG